MFLNFRGFVSNPLDERQIEPVCYIRKRGQKSQALCTSPQRNSKNGPDAKSLAELPRNHRIRSSVVRKLQPILTHAGCANPTLEVERRSDNRSRRTAARGAPDLSTLIVGVSNRDAQIELSMELRGDALEMRPRLDRKLLAVVNLVPNWNPLRQFRFPILKISSIERDSEFG